MKSRKLATAFVFAASTCLFAGSPAHSDVVTEWNSVALDITAAGTKSTVKGNHILTMVQTAVFVAVNSITKAYPPADINIEADSGASVEAAIASSSQAMLIHFLPKQKAAIDKAYANRTASIESNDAKDAGVAAGQRATAAVLKWRKQQKSQKAEAYRPATSPGVYVPTAMPVGCGWAKKPTWILNTPDQLRPEPPPALTSATWAKDYNEVKMVGAKNSQKRTADQTEMALFWQATFPTIYYPVIHSVAASPGRDLTRNARLFAIAGQAVDDALIAVLDAKYAHHFWRPVTAINNGDQDSNDATDRIAGWKSLIPAPMHPEYPCAHCIVSGAIAGVLNADLGGEPSPPLKTQSPKLPGVTRSWRSPDDFAREVVDARIFDGVHYRTSGEVGTRMGKEIASMAFKKFSAR